MPMRVVGVYPISAEEPVHLVEIELPPDSPEPDWARITQRVVGEPEDNWQVPYDEARDEDAPGRWTFFFHYLDPSKPLSTAHGEVAMPPVTPLPERFKHREYDAP